MLTPPFLQQPAPAQPAPKAELGPLAALLQKRGVVVALKRHPLGALYGHGTVEVEALEASDGTDTREGLGFHVIGPSNNDAEGRMLLDKEEIPALLSALDRFQAEAAKLGGADGSFTYLSQGGLALELARDRGDLTFSLRAGRGQAVLAASQVAALKQLIEKAK